MTKKMRYMTRDQKTLLAYIQSRPEAQPTFAYNATHPNYVHGFTKDKLNNAYFGKNEGWSLLNSQGQDIGQLSVALISDSRKKDKIGPANAMTHLKGEFDVQKNSFLQEHQWLSPANADEDLRNPEEKHYTHAVASIGGKRIGFAVVDRDKFADGEEYIKWFFTPTLRTKGEDFSGSQIRLPHGHKMPLENLIRGLSLNHVVGNKGGQMLSVYDAPEQELGNIGPYFQALAPKFDVPKVDARTIKDYKEKADGVYIVVHNNPFVLIADGTRQKGLELDKAIQLYHGYLREAYFPQFADVKDGKKVQLTGKIEAAREMYEGGILKLVESARKVDGKLIVPFKGWEDIGKPLTAQEITEQGLTYLMKGEKMFQHYVRYPAKK